MVHAVRPFACPNQGFMRQLMVLAAFCMSAGWTYLTLRVNQAFEEAEASQRGGRVYQTRAASRLAGVAPC